MNRLNVWLSRTNGEQPKACRSLDDMTHEHTNTMGDPASKSRARRLVLACVAVVIAGAGLAGAGWWATQPSAQQPNILVISLCSVRADHLSSYGYARRTSPNLDQLAGESTVFEHAVTQWPKTAPAFGTLMTGKYGHTTGVTRITPQQFLGDDHVTLAEVLRDHGYATAMFNSTPALNPATNLLQGFETVDDTYRSKTPYADATSAATTWILQPREKPFMAWVHFNNAHHPYVAPGMPEDMFFNDEHYKHEPLLQSLPRTPLDLPVPASHPFRRQILHPDLGGAHPSVAVRPEPTALGYYMARYDAGIASADAMIGKLLDRLTEAGLLENTIVLVVSDHGESMGKSNYYFGHGRFPYDDCARVPLIVRLPKDNTARRITAPVPTFAVMPTLLELVGIAPPTDIDARSLVPILQGHEPPRYVFAESGYQIDYTLAARDDTWKLIYIPNKLDQSLQRGTEYELYNLRTDPDEQHNLYSNAPTEAARLRHVLHDWSDPWIDYAYGKEPQKAPIVDDDTLKKLKALGYVD